MTFFKKYRRCKRGIETVTAVFMMLLMFGVLIGLVFAFSTQNSMFQGLIGTENSQAREQIILSKQIDFSTNKLSGITLYNAGTVEETISGLYITASSGQVNYLDLSYKSPQNLIKPKDRLPLGIADIGPDLISSTSIIATTTNGVLSSDGPLPTPTPAPTPTPDINSLVYGPVKLIFSEIWHASVSKNPSDLPNANWQTGDITGNGDYTAWRIKVTNIDKDPVYKPYPIVLNSKSVLTLIPTAGSTSSVRVWYIYSDQQYSLVYQNPTYIYFVYDSEASKQAQKIYTQASGAQVFLTLFGSYPAMTPVKDYGQTIPFEAILVK
jgi:hypothetical protein